MTMAELGQQLALLLVYIAFAVGLVGAIVPFVPGLLVIWAAVFAYAAFIDGWQAIHPLLFVLITLITFTFTTADLWLPLVGSKKTGASAKTMLLGMIGAVAGTFLLPVLGTIIGYVVGILAAEWLRHREARPAVRAGFGALLGWGVGTAMELIGCVLVILIFVARVN